MTDAVVAGRLGQALLDVLDPLRQALQSPMQFEALLRREGWQPPATQEYFATISDAFKLVGALEKAATAIESLLAGDQPDASAILAAIDDVVKVISDLRTIQKPSGTLLSPFDLDEFWSTFPSDLVADLFLHYMEVAQPSYFAPLYLLGILDEEFVDPAGKPGKLPFVRRTVVWDRLVTLVSDPLSLVRDVYGWGSTLAYDKLMLRLERVLRAFGVPAGRYIPHNSLVALYYSGTTPPDAVRELRVPLLEDRIGDSAFVRVGLLALAIPPAGSPAAAPVGIFVGPYTYGQGAARVELGGPFALELKGGLDAAGDVGLEIRPGSFNAHVGTSGTDLDVEASLALEPQSPFVLLGSEDSHRIQLGKGKLGLSLTGPVASTELQLNLQFDSLQFIFDPSDGDSFLTEVFGTDPKTAEASGALTWSSKTGLHFSGQSQLSTSIPLHITIGPIMIQGIRISIDAGAKDVALTVAITVGAQIGPVQAEVQDIGAKLDLVSVTAPARGTFGDLDLQFGFKPPTGIGLAIDVSGLTGGGFLSHDEAASQYAGMLQLSYQQFQLQAFGLITTKLPTGPGYSLIAMIDANFPPIELVAGFTLNGVGGLLGINRTISIDALEAGIKAKTLSNFLFAKNPVANAAQLLTDLDTFFPAAQGRYVFGPLLQIGWGGPAITIDLALVLELPDPVRLVLIGELAVLLPNPDAALIVLHMDVLGTIDFGTDEGSLDAVLHDSRIVSYPLLGAMAFRGCWAGGDKTFLLSIGGFHPKFQPPPAFPTLQRLSISMPSGHISKLNLNGYLAVSSNTLQIGAHLDIFVGVDGFGISGYLNFDTLIERNPFYFDGDISGGVTLSADGDDIMSLDLSADLTGPAPWHCAGSVHFSVLGFGVTKSFSTTFGSQAPALPTNLVDVGAAIRAALGDPRNYSATLTSNENGLVTLRTPTMSGAMPGHPGASLKIDQKICPLGLTIQKFGAGAPAGDALFTITLVTADGSAQTPTPLTDEFAPALFLNLSDDDELAAPSFEAFASGVELGGGALASGPILSRPIVYETWIVDAPGGTPRPDAGYTPPIDRLSGIRTVLKNSGRLRYAMPSQPMVRAATLDYVIATTDQIAASGVGVATGQTFAQARAALAAAVAENPDQRGALQIVPHYEVAA
jgi:hypothetical protein